MNENKPIIKLCLFVGWWWHWWWPRKNITGFAKLDFLKSPLTLWEVSKTQWPKNLCWKSRTKGQRCEICFRISFVILQRWVDISFNALIFHFYKTWISRNEIWHQKENITQVGFRTFQDISLEQCWFFSWDKSFIEEEKAVKSHPRFCEKSFK